MTKKIFKYEMDFQCAHQMPCDAEFLDVGLQGDTPCAWFMVCDVLKTEERKFKIFGTGHEIPMSARYLGSFQQPPFVWHLHEVNHEP